MFVEICDTLVKVPSSTKGEGIFFSVAITTPFAAKSFGLELDSEKFCIRVG